jgi:hypothetical protein
MDLRKPTILTIPDLRIDASMLPDRGREEWVQREQVDRCMAAWGLPPKDKSLRSKVGVFVAYRASRQAALALARVAYRRGDKDTTAHWVRRARGQHRVVLRKLHGLRELLESSDRPV